MKAAVSVDLANTVATLNQVDSEVNPYFFHYILKALTKRIKFVEDNYPFLDVGVKYGSFDLSTHIFVKHILSNSP